MNDNPLKSIVKLAIENDASDIHIKEGNEVVFRIKSDLLRADYIPNKNAINSILAKLLTDKLRKQYEETGDVDLSYVEEEHGRFRVNIHKQKGKDAVSMRYVKAEIDDFEGLGLPHQIQKIAELERGIVFVTGTTGAGKSTTLASIIEYINSNRKSHIITIEDPIEYEFTDKKSFIEQRELGLDTVTYDSALTHSLRQDPDVIMVGEMRSRKSFDCALKAADTGHLIFSTLHTLNATQTINRILNFYNSDEQQSIRYSLANNLAGIVSQRLVKTANDDGLVPALEIMFNNSTIRNMLYENKISKLHSAVENSKNEGMQTFKQSLMDLVQREKISSEEALKMADNPEALKMNLKGVYLNTDNQILQ